MGKTRTAALLLTMCGVLGSGCAYRSPDPGHEAVLVDYPWIWGGGGVQQEPLTTGSHLVWSSTKAVYIDMRPLAFGLQFVDIPSRDTVPVDFDAQLRLQVTDSVKLVSAFGERFYDTNLAKPFENAVRRAVNKHDEVQIATDPMVIATIDAEVTKALEVEITGLGIPVKLLSVTVGKANPPDSIKAQRAETAAQRQRQQTEQQRTLAEGQRARAEAARATADNAYRNSLGLSGAQFIELERVKAWERMCSTAGKCIVGNIGQAVVQ